MGKRGMTKLQDLFLGSTSRKVLHSIEDRILILVS
jgi:nucleotide-binding universal stress UspA family protein